jgi:EXLDI family protein
MPTKTIYVSNEDQITFDTAQKLAGENLSAVIVRALSEFITRKEAVGKGMKEMAVQIGSKGLQSEKRFVGRVIAKWKGMDEKTGAWVEAVIYKTKKDNLAIALTRKGSTELWEPDAWQRPDYWKLAAEGTELIVGEHLDQIRSQLPDGLAHIAEQAINRDEAPVEYLDI